MLHIPTILLFNWANFTSVWKDQFWKGKKEWTRNSIEYHLLQKFSGNPEKYENLEKVFWGSLWENVARKLPDPVIYYFRLFQTRLKMLVSSKNILRTQNLALACFQNNEVLFKVRNVTINKALCSPGFIRFMG